MKKTALCSLVILSLFLFAFAPTPAPPNKEKDKVANKLLKDVSKKYKGYKSMKADFSMTTEPSEASKAPKKTEKGTLISKGSNFKLSFAGQEIFCNGKNIWTYTKETNECVKDNYNPNSSTGLNPAKIFTVWEKGFLYAGDGNYKKGSQDIAKIKLTPTDKTKPYFLMNLEVDQAAKTVQSLKVSFKAGHKQTYVINSQSPNVAVDDKTFEFNPSAYAGVEMIDLTKKK
jgi:outer membrane lipoprotein carrier protein